MLVQHEISRDDDGLTFAQDPHSAEFASMPEHAISIRAVDMIMSTRRIAAELTKLVRHPIPRDKIIRREHLRSLIEAIHEETRAVTEVNGKIRRCTPAAKDLFSLSDGDKGTPFRKVALTCPCRNGKICSDGLRRLSRAWNTRCGTVTATGAGSNCGLAKLRINASTAFCL